jgi:uncharacterized protein YecE (DUF72 family)
MKPKTQGSDISSGDMVSDADLLAERQGIWIGTSGWTYDSWRGPFYPSAVPKKDWLTWYGSNFPSTEINASFYRTPSLKAARDWRKRTPRDFVFAWKASKFITHWKRLNDTCANSIELMESRLKLLGPKAGPVLFQLPGNFQADRERLARFIKMLPAHRRYAFEFRHPSWYERGILDLLASNNISLCLADHHLASAPWIATAEPRVCARTRTRWPLPGQLSSRNVAQMVTTHACVATGGPAGLRLFRQRSEECRACGCQAHDCAFGFERPGAARQAGCR